jgi:hypothetical protein
MPWRLGLLMLVACSARCSGAVHGWSHGTQHVLGLLWILATTGLGLQLVPGW